MIDGYKKYIPRLVITDVNPMGVDAAPVSRPQREVTAPPVGGDDDIPF